VHGSEPTNKSYRTDETYIKVKGEHKYLYRAVRRLNYEFAMDKVQILRTRASCVPWPASEPVQPSVEPSFRPFDYL